MIVYVIRHGESLANIKQSTEADCSLSPRGERQAIRVRDFFDRNRLDTVFSSPLRRTIQTSLSLARSKQLPVMLVPEMTEY
ncbi:histidine phosphatase family protein [Cohnella hashimotonis]|uniref:Histidine phosphatase family protein n=1 Tax=Cohnella hashimotonis TaxID=2826895 RepID=A0ABT6TE83_9BACL|nr:histidine phosphatase family protein [Cohnella hashimotonis]MDI4645127.1 histidine phosphatase family protein [Cohnella hashimotonis]